MMSRRFILLILFLFTACETGVENQKKDPVKHVSWEESRHTSHAHDSSIDELVGGVDPKIKVATTPVKEAMSDDDYQYEVDLLEEDRRRPKEVKDVKEVVAEVLEEEIPTEREKKLNSVSGGTLADGLNVKKIRVGYHDTFTRLAFDIDQHSNAEPAKSVGTYNFSYNPQTYRITVVINGYRGFSAKFPQFSSKRVVEKMYFSKYLDDSGYKFYIQLREHAKIKGFSMKNPAKIVLDIAPL